MLMEKWEGTDDWKGAETVPLYKGKGIKKECKNYRGIANLANQGRCIGN